MKKLIGLFMLVMILSAGMASLSYAAGEMTAPSETVNGDVLKIEGEFYTVHDTAGHEVRLHVDKTTQLEGTFKAGDKVEAQATDKGHALSMRHVNVAGSGGPHPVKGDVLKIEGEFYTVHDTAGHEVRLHVDKTTQLEGTFKAGDKVEAQATDKGHALSMRHVNVAGSGGPHPVKGDVLKIEGEFYTVHDTAGHEVRLHVDKTTQLEGTFKAGDKVAAQVTNENHILSIRHAAPAK